MRDRRIFSLGILIVSLLALLCPAVSALTSYERMVLDLVSLEKAGRDAGDARVSIFSIGNSAQGRQIPLALLHDSALPVEQTRKLLIMCRQHGNEPASTEAALDFIREMATTKDESRKAILRKVSFFIIPMVNPDGAERFQRKNANGADLNRDWVDQTQPETKAIVGAVKMYRPDAVIDAHELAPGNNTEDFVEAVSERAGASAPVAEVNRTLQDIVLQTLKAYGQLPDRIESQSNRVPTLAHRYFAVALGVPAVLFETKQAGARAYDLSTRKDIHEAGMMAVARYLAGDDFGDIERMLSQQAQKAAAATLLRKSRITSQLPSRAGKAKRWTPKSRSKK